MGLTCQNPFSEHGHVACQIKGNHEMQQQSCKYFPSKPPTHPTTLGDGVKMSNFNFFRTWSCCISNYREPQKWQHGSKIFCPQTPFPPTKGFGSKGQNQTFSEHSHAALRLHTPHDPRGLGQKAKIKLFQNMAIWHIKLKGITNAATW